MNTNVRHHNKRRTNTRYLPPFLLFLVWNGQKNVVDLSQPVRQNRAKNEVLYFCCGSKRQRLCLEELYVFDEMTRYIEGLNNK